MKRPLPTTPIFENVSIIIAAMNETTSLRKTVETLYETCKLSDIKEIILVVSKRSTPECLKVGEQLRQEAKVPFQILVQTKPFAGGAYQDAFDQAHGSHVVMMASDLETDPNDVKALIDESRKNPGMIIATTRWLVPGQFHGYSKIKLVCNWIFQRFFSILYGTHLTDMTYGFRLLPTKMVQAIKWEELRHPFNLETVVKPLRLGVPVSEISTGWKARIEGESQNPFFRNFEYFKTGLLTRFASPASLLK